MRDDAAWCQLVVDKVVLRQAGEDQLVFLRHVGGEIVFPIAVGLYEALAIQSAMDAPASRRPLTHELVFGVVTALGGGIRCALIESILGGVFYAKLMLRNAAGDVVDVDCRPSDAICVAHDAGAPLYAPRELLRAVSSGTP